MVCPRKFSPEGLVFRGNNVILPLKSSTGKQNYFGVFLTSLLSVAQLYGLVTHMFEFVDKKKVFADMTCVETVNWLRDAICNSGKSKKWKKKTCGLLQHAYPIIEIDGKLHVTRVSDFDTDEKLFEKLFQLWNDGGLGDLSGIGNPTYMMTGYQSDFTFHPEMWIPDVTILRHLNSEPNSDPDKVRKIKDRLAKPVKVVKRVRDEDTDLTPVSNGFVYSNEPNEDVFTTPPKKARV